jgi:hypothetical protein
MCHENVCRFDTNGNGVISATIFSATLQSMGIHKQEGERGYLEIFDEAIRDSSLSQATDLDFETFMFIMGLQGSNEDYVAMEIDDRRRRYKEMWSVPVLLPLYDGQTHQYVHLLLLLTLCPYLCALQVDGGPHNVSHV